MAQLLSSCVSNVLGGAVGHLLDTVRVSVLVVSLKIFTDQNPASAWKDNSSSDVQTNNSRRRGRRSIQRTALASCWRSPLQHNVRFNPVYLFRVFTVTEIFDAKLQSSNLSKENIRLVAGSLTAG